MTLRPTNLERNSRLSVALVKNRAEQNNLSTALDRLEKEKKTALRILQHDKQYFKLKFSKSNVYTEGNSVDETLSKYYIPSTEDASSVGGDNASTYSFQDFEQIHNMLFTNDEVDIDKILCLHLISAHRTESLAPPKRKLVHMCKIHSPMERLLERSKRKHIHHEQRMTNLLPIYTIETMEFGNQNESRDLINDGRLATRILLNERVRQLINTVLNALRQSNPEKNYEIFQLANDVSCLKKLFTHRKIIDFLDDLMTCPLINSCESFVLTAPFRVKSIQLEIRTISGALEALVKQIRQNVLQLPPLRVELNSSDTTVTKKVEKRFSYSKFFTPARGVDDGGGMGSKDLADLYSERRSHEGERKLGRHLNTNFVQKNIMAAATVKKVEYDSDDCDDYYHRPRRSSQSSNQSRSRRSSGSDQSSILDRPNIQPIQISEDVNAIMEDNHESLPELGEEKPTRSSKDLDQAKQEAQSKRKTSTDIIKFHLKQTTCPACMERYKIPLPPPKTPRVKPSSVIPLAPGEDSTALKTNSQHRISMLINKEMFKLQSYERRFSSNESSRRNSLKNKELEACSSSYTNLSPLELARIEQEIKEKETQKKLIKFLKE